MKTDQTRLSLSLQTALVALALLAPACGGGGGGGGASGDLGAFADTGQVVAIDPGTMTTRVAATGGTGRRVGNLARDSVHDLCYAVDFDTSELLRIDDAGRVALVGVLDEPVSAMAYAPDRGELLGVQSNGRRGPSKLLRIDPATAEVTIVADTSGVADVAYDGATARLLGVLIGSTGVRLNTLVAIDVNTGVTQTLFDDPGFGQARGLAFDPLTRTLFAAQTGEPGSVLEYSLNPPGVQRVTQYERWFQGFAFDDDDARQFGLSTGGEVFECTNPSGNTAGGMATPIATLSRELHGFAFDPADGRFFAMDTPNHEIVKFDPARNRTTRVAYLERRARQSRDVRSLAYDPVRARLFGMDARFQELLSIDPVTGEGQVVPVSLGVDTILAMDPDAGRLFAYDQAVEVLVEVDPDRGTIDILDNAIGLTKVDDMDWDPITGRLVAIHESPGRTGESTVSSVQLVGTASPLPHSIIPDGLTAFGRDSRTGLYHAVGPRQPRVEMELDLTHGSSFFQTIRTIDGAWSTSFRAALWVSSLGAVLAIDDERVYSYDPRSREMVLKGSMPTGVLATDLVYDPAAGTLGLRRGDKITWVSPDQPFRPVGTSSAPVQTDLRFTGYGTGNAYGVLDGILFEVRYGSAVSLRALTPVARANFDVEHVTYSASARTVLATGRDTTTGESILVRYDVATGEWTDLGVLRTSVRATFQD